MSTLASSDQRSSSTDKTETRAIIAEPQTPGQVAGETGGTLAQHDPWRPALALVALGLALVAQFSLLKPGSFERAILLYAGALLALLLLSWRAPEGIAIGNRMLESGRRFFGQVHALIDAYFTRATIVTLAFLVDLTAVLLLSVAHGDTRGARWDAFALWVLAILLFLVATLQPGFSRSPSLFRASHPTLARALQLQAAGRRFWRKHGVELLVVLVLTAGAFALRFAGLGGEQELLDGDEGDLGLYVVRVLRGDARDMFATYRSFGTLYLFLLALPVKVFGASPFALRFVAALSGSLTVPMLFLLGRRLFDARVGFIAAAMLAVSHYHLHFSRTIASGNALDALLVTVLLYLFYRGLEERNRNLLILSGLVLGLAQQYMYSGSRLTGVIMIAYVGLLFLLWRRVVLDNLGSLVLCALMALLVSLPMIRWALTHPGEFMGQVQAIGIFQTGWLATQARMTHQPEWLIIAQQLGTAFLSFNYHPVRGFYDATIPALDLLSSALFVLGVGYSLLQVHDRRFLLLNLWFWSGLFIGGALLVNPDASVYRILIVFPAVALLTAISLSKLVDLGTYGLGYWRQIALIVPIAFIGFLNLKYFFSEYLPGCRYPDSDTAAAAVVGKYLQGLGTEYQTFFLGSRNTPIDGYHNLPFLSGRQVQGIYDPLESAANIIDKTRPVAFFIRPYRDQDLQWLREHYASGTSVELRRCDELLVTVYRVDHP